MEEAEGADAQAPVDRAASPLQEVTPAVVAALPQIGLRLRRYAVQ